MKKIFQTLSSAQTEEELKNFFGTFKKCTNSGRALLLEILIF